MKQIVRIPAKVLEPLRHYLVEQEKKLKQREKDLAKEDPFSDPDRLNDNASPDSDAAEQFGHERVSALQEATSKMLVRVRQTMTKIKIGRYGLCEECGNMIDTDRLSIDPTAQYCVACEKKRASTK